MNINKNKSPFTYLIVFLLALSSLFYFILFTSPKNLPVLILLMPIVSVFLLFYLIFYWIIKKSIFTNKVYSARNSALLAAVYSVVPVLLLVMASIGEFTFKDVFLALALFLAIIIYFSRVDFIKKK